MKKLNPVVDETMEEQNLWLENLDLARKNTALENSMRYCRLTIDKYKTSSDTLLADKEKLIKLLEEQTKALNVSDKVSEDERRRLDSAITTIVAKILPDRKRRGILERKVRYQIRYEYDIKWADGLSSDMVNDIIADLPSFVSEARKL